MINIKENKYNIILGALFGFVLAQFIIVEGNGIIIQRLETYEGTNSGGVNNLITYINIFAGIIFLLSIIIFNTRRFRKINFNKISIYLILVVLVSLFASFEGTLLLCQIIIKITDDFLYRIMENYLGAINIAYLILFIAISIFLMTFIFLVNRKVKYIKYLTKEVKVIKDEGFGKTIKVSGGDELAELCRGINDMSLELGERIENEKKIEKNKNELITNISHDLKTPLTSIVGYLELLNTKEVDDDTKDEYINIAYNKSLRLKSLVNELFEYTKLTSDNIDLRKSKVNISMLLNQAVGESIINFQEKNIEVILDNPYNEAYSIINPIEILRVFENLLRNAEKYGDSNSVFKVTLNIIDDKILISFINKCESIKDDDLEYIFERFYRMDKSRSEEGSGLGLAIVKRIIELHCGSITVNKIGDNIKFDILINQA